MAQRAFFTNELNMASNHPFATSVELSSSKFQDTEVAFALYPDPLEELRQQRVYEAFKQDIMDYLDYETKGNYSKLYVLIDTNQN